MKIYKFGQLNVNSDVVKATILQLLSSGFIIIANSFSTSLFLSVYSSKMLPFLYFCQAFTIPIITFLVGGYLATSTSKNKYLFVYQFIIIINIVFAGILNFKLIKPYQIVFVFCLILIGSAIITGVTTWNVITRSFDIRRFKKVGKKINISGNIGAFLFGVIASITTMYYSMKIFYVLLIILPTFMYIIVHNIKQYEQTTIYEHENKNPFSYMLFNVMLINAILYLFISILADYSLKSKLGFIYNGEQIAIFMSLMFAAIAVIGFVLQLFTVDVLIEKIGAYSLILILPLITLFTSAFSAIHSNLATYTTVFGCTAVLYYSYSNLGRQLLLSVLPASVREFGMFLIKIISYPVGIGCSAITIWLGANYLSPRHNMMFISLVCVFMLGIVYLVRKYYISSLEDIVLTKRFISDSYYLVANNYSLRRIALKAIKNDDVETKKYGLLLLLKDKDIPMSLLSQISYCFNSKDVSIRKYAYNIVMRCQDNSATQLLISQYALEQDENLKGDLMYMLSSRAPKVIANEAKQKLYSSASYKLLGSSIYTLLLNASEDEVIVAKNKLDTLFCSNDPLARMEVANILSRVKVNNSIRLLGKLLNDINKEVSMIAISAWITNYRNSEFIPIVINKLSDNIIGSRIAVLLPKLGNDVIPFITDVLTDKLDIFNYRCINILIDIHTNESINALLGFYKTCIIPLQNYITYHLAMYCIKNFPGTNMVDFVEREMFVEIGNIKYLYVLLEKVSNQIVISEILSRINMAKERCLYWLTIANGDKIAEILSIIPSLLKSIDFNNDKKDLSLTYELLETYVKKTKFKKIIKSLELLPEYLDAGNLIVGYSDKWLDYIIKNTSIREGKNMEELDKLFVLRKNELFTKFPGEALLILANSSKLIDFIKGEAIFKKGDIGDGLYIIVTGEVQIQCDDAVLNTLQAPSHFGELSLIDDKPRAANAIANVDALLLFVNKNDFITVALNEPLVLIDITKTIIKYLRKNLI